MSLIKSDLNWPSVSDFFEDSWLKERLGKESIPAVNVAETDKNYEMEIAAPGYRKNDFSVSVDNGILNICAEQEEEKKEEKKNYTRKEFSSRSFSRNFTLPQNVREDDISANYEDGVLHLILNKSKESHPTKKEITIK